MGWELKLEPIDWDAKDALHRQRHHQLHLERLHHGKPRGRLSRSPSRICYNEQVVVVKTDSGAKNARGPRRTRRCITQVDSAALHVLEQRRTRRRAARPRLPPRSRSCRPSATTTTPSCSSSPAWSTPWRATCPSRAYQMAAKPDAYVQAGRACSTEHYAVGFKKGDTELAEQGHRRPQAAIVRGGHRQGALRRSTPSHGASPTTTGFSSSDSGGLPAAERLRRCEALTHPACPLYRLPARAASTLRLRKRGDRVHVSASR